MRNKLLLSAAAVMGAGLIVIPLLLAQGQEQSLRADLKGENEVPAVSTTGEGTFLGTVNATDTEIAWTLVYSGLSGTPTQAHIHFGQKNVVGAFVYWICGSASNPGPANTPVCPAGPAHLTGFARPANIVAAASQGIAAGDFEEVLAAIRDGNGYVNVHTAQSPGGEIRGQIKAGGGPDGDKGGGSGKKKGKGRGN